MLAPFEITAIDFVGMAKEYSVPNASESLGIYVVQSGIWTLTIDKQQDPGSDWAPSPVSESLSQQLREGEVAIVTQPVSHHLRLISNPSPSSSYLRILLKPSSAESQVLLAGYPELVRAESLFSAEFSANLSSLSKSNRHSELTGLLLDSMASLIIGLVLKTVIKQDPHFITSNNGLAPEIAETLRAMEQDPGNQWTIETLASVAGISRSALAQKFKEQVGTTLNHHLLEVRMRLADTLLKSRRHHLKEIARMTGYQSASSFSTAFKRWSGKSPSSLRKAD
ncbi:helix-turn-helix transcriptional regulator [Planctomicrobium sp. SH668]|uniref:helix-turn-helix transcriptional regulator n=1 Tax=Planctomicrobium sp. SH668 TaxID=3448126 RepID=UPI003F5C515F